MSTASRDAGRQRPAQRSGPKPITIVISVVILVIVLLVMVLASGALGIWPPKAAITDTIKPGSAYASMVDVEVVGTPVASTVQSSHIVTVAATETTVTDTLTTVTVTVKIMNNVLQSPIPTEVVGTPISNPPTTVPEPAKILYVTVKLLFYDQNNKLVGNGVGYYNNPAGLDNKASATFDVVASDVEGFDPATGTVKPFVDNLLTDKDPVKTPVPSSYAPGKRGIAVGGIASIDVILPTT